VELMERELSEIFDIYFSIGSTRVFPYIRHPMTVAKRRGRPTVEINPDQTEISSWVDIKIPLKAAEALRAIWSASLVC